MVSPFNKNTGRVIFFKTKLFSFLPIILTLTRVHKINFENYFEIYDCIDLLCASYAGVIQYNE